PRRARSRLRRRAEPRCAAPFAADAGDQRAQGQAALHPGLWRLAAVEPPRRRRRHEPAAAGAELVMPTPKPGDAHPHLSPNTLGLTLREYEGAPSTLCAG